MTPGFETQLIEEPASGLQRILCCSCGTPIAPNAANMCINCIKGQVDITEGIPKQATVHFCRACERYLQPPGIWIVAQLESRELLTLCLKKLKGLAKVRLVDAGFIWTEPHSKRIKIKLTVQKEAFHGTILQQVFVVEYVVANQTCDDCHKVAAQNTWKASIQVRQKVNHKRTFFFLEQLILKHNAHRDTVNIKEMRDGIDFYYLTKQHALRMVEFLSSVVPIRTKSSEQLISADVHTSSANYKVSYSVEIAPICKDDLLCLPPKLARSASNISPICICYKVGTMIQLVDPNTCKTADIRNSTYWEHEFKPLCEAKDLVEFFVIDVTYDYPLVQNNKFTLANVEVCRGGDFDNSIITRSHLGHILRPGDHVVGYDLSHTNVNHQEWDRLVEANASNLPDVVLVKKSYPNRRRKTRTRNWKLGRLAKVADDSVLKDKGKDRSEVDYEMFLRDIEEDVDMRSAINLYKSQTHGAKVKSDMDVDMDGAQLAVKDASVRQRKSKRQGEGDLSLSQSAGGAAARRQSSSVMTNHNSFSAISDDLVESKLTTDDESADAEEDFPEIKLEELLEELTLEDAEEDL